MPLRIFLVDDHEVVRRGVRELLESEDDFEVVGEAGSVEEALARIHAVSPDIAVLDVRLRTAVVSSCAVSFVRLIPTSPV